MLVGELRKKGQIKAKDFMKAFNISFSEVIKQKGLENVTVDDLVAEITPQGRGDHFGFIHKINKCLY